MNKSQVLGFLVLVASLIGLVLYGWLLFLSQWSVLTLELTCFIGAALVLGIVAWIGYTLATTLPPKPIEEVEKPLERSENSSCG